MERIIAYAVAFIPYILIIIFLLYMEFDYRKIIKDEIKCWETTTQTLEEIFEDIKGLPYKE